jgi:hypothetical protein
MIPYERFVQLVALAKQQGIHINFDGVPPERQQSDERFFQSYEQMYNDVTNLYWVSAFCLHEAGHKLYFAEIGVTQFEYLPPTIKYNETIDDYDGHYAAFEVKDINPPENMPIDQAIWLLARGFAAGAELAEHLANAPRNGEQKDRKRFGETCDAFLAAYPGLSIDRSSAWTQAKNAILQEMQNPANKEAAFGTAEEIKAAIFPWIKSPITPFPTPPHS